MRPSPNLQEEPLFFFQKSRFLPLSVRPGLPGILQSRKDAIVPLEEEVGAFWRKGHVFSPLYRIPAHLLLRTRRLDLVQRQPAVAILP